MFTSTCFVSDIHDEDEVPTLISVDVDEGCADYDEEEHPVTLCVSQRGAGQFSIYLGAKSAIALSEKLDELAGILRGAC